MVSNHSGDETVKSIVKMFDIVEYVQERGGARPTEVADEFGMAKSTAHRHLSTLEQTEYLVKEDDRYVLGLRFLDLGQDARNRNKFFQMVKPKVKELAEETEERAQFITEEHGQAVYIYRNSGAHGIQTDPGIGKRLPLHCNSAGKAILANLPEETVWEILDRRGLEQRTPNTITDPDELFDELATIRERGYSVNHEENISGQCAVGVAIMASEDEVVGGLSVSGPVRRITGERMERTLPDLLLGMANELELNIQHTATRV